MFKNLTLERFIKWAIGLSGAALVIWVLMNYSNLVAYAIISILLSYLLDPIVNRMESKGMNRTLSISITLIVVGLILTWISTTIIPILTNQMVGLTRQLNVENIRYIADQIEGVLLIYFEFLEKGFLVKNITTYGNQLFDINQMPDILANLIGIFTNVFSAILVIPFATFFFLKDGSKIRRDILQLIPNKYFETTLTVINKIETRLGIYFRSVLVQSSLVAILSWILLSLAGLTNALSVGITIGLANTIPYFGPIIGYLLSIAVSIIETGDFSLLVPCIIAVMIVQVTDNVIFQPFIFSRSADMHPVSILFIILIGAETAGILGMLVAIPIATTIKIMINQISWSFKNYKVFNDDTPQLPTPKSAEV